MSELKKKALWLTLLGFALGLGVGLLFCFVFEPDGFLTWNENKAALTLYLIASGLYGAVNMGTSAVYGIEKWSILRCTFTHFLITVFSTVAFFGMMILLGWMDMPPAGVCAVFGVIFVAVYASIWLFQYLAYRRKVKNLNAKLRAWKKSRES